MAKEFTISSMDPDVTAVRGLYTGRIYRQVKDEWWEGENDWGETTRITWFALLAKEAKAFEVPFASVGSIVHATELDRLPLMTVLRGMMNDMVYIKTTTTELAYSEGDRLVRYPISQLQNEFRVEWIDEGGEV